MSYDLNAVRVPEGMTPAETIEAREELDERPPTAEEREAMERLAADLLAVDPSAERHDDEDAIELTFADMQISLFAEEAAISIPYWFEGSEGDAVMARAWSFAGVLARAGYTVFDPQTEEVVAGGDPGAAARDTYASAKSSLDRYVEEPERPPRWQFWRR